MSNPCDLTQSSEQSATLWPEQLQKGDSAAAQHLWQRYVERLVRLVHREQGDLPRRVAAEDDLVLSACNDFLYGVEKGRFTRFDSRKDLIRRWWLPEFEP